MSAPRVKWVRHGENLEVGYLGEVLMNIAECALSWEVYVMDGRYSLEDHRLHRSLKAARRSAIAMARKLGAR